MLFTKLFLNPLCRCSKNKLCNIHYNNDLTYLKKITLRIIILSFFSLKTYIWLVIISYLVWLSKKYIITTFNKKQCFNVYTSL